MIIFDTETTNLVAPEAAPTAQQPSMVEFAAIKVHPDTLIEQARLSFLVNPLLPIPREATAIHGITNAMVQNVPPFAARFPELVNFFGGQRTVVAHNLAFDIRVLYYELQRIDRVTAFPWPPRQICTVEATMSIKGYRLSLGVLCEILLSRAHKENAHRAMADVVALLDCVRELRKQKLV